MLKLTRKLPMRAPRASLPTPTLTPIEQTHIHLQHKYLSISVNAFHFRKIQTQLYSKLANRQLSITTSPHEQLIKYYSFSEIKQKIKGVVIQRVQKDYLYGVTFHHPWKVLTQYVNLQRKNKQRNLFNLYYFSNHPPKISQITQPTITTLHTQKGPQTNSTLELKTLSHHIDLMLHKSVPFKSTSTGKRSRQEKSQKPKRKPKMAEEIFQQTYGLKNYKKGKKSKSRSQARGSLSRGSISKVQFCITPQPHAYQNFQYQRPRPQLLPARLSERKTGKSKSGSKRDSLGYRRKGC